MIRLLLPALLLVFSFSCRNKAPLDTIYFNAKIYTVDKDNTIAEAMAVRNGKVLAVGKKDDLLRQYKRSEQIDLQGKTVFPGLIDAHCHFYGYGLNLIQADLKWTESWAA